MNEQKVENWNGHDIRFVNINGEWWALGRDITSALEYKDSSKAIEQHVRNKNRKSLSIKAYGDLSDTFWLKNDFSNKVVVDENGIYSLIFGSHMPKAEEFQDWAFDVIKQLRQSTGLEGFEVFRMMGKKHQREAMKNLHDGIGKPVKVSYIKANAIANKAISNKYGYPKMIKKSNMSPNMLKERESVLNDTVDLMKAKDKFNLNISISDKIYSKYSKTSIK